MSEGKAPAFSGDADELAIRNLIARLAHLADDGGLDEYMVCFTEDAKWGGGAQPIRTGHNEIRTAAKARRDSGVTGPGSSSRHVTATSWIELDGASATARTVFHFYTDTDSEPVLRSIGVYHDTFQKTQDIWKLSGRQLEGAVKDLPTRT